MSYEATHTPKYLFSEEKNREKLILVRSELENQFLVIFSKSKHFRVYVASQLLHKYGHCEHHALLEKLVRPSGLEKLAL